MSDSRLLIAAMARECRALIHGTGGTGHGLPGELRPEHLLGMCQRIERHAKDWPETKLHRWIGFVQCGMMANGMLDIVGIKKMFDGIKKIRAVSGIDEELIDHLDPDNSFELDIGGEG